MKEFVQSVSQLHQITSHGRSLDTSALSPLASEITYGVLRHYFHLDELVGVLTNKPLPTKHNDLRLLIMTGLYAVDHLHRPAHASVNAAVNAVKPLGKSWARGLVNATLRRYLRENDQLRPPENEEATWNHPEWIIRHIREAWGDNADAIFTANNSRAPLTLRVNPGQTTRERYLEDLVAAGIDARPGQLSDAAVILANSVSVHSIPGFDEGLVSVQDEASQLAANLLAPIPGSRVFDACAAPGGKTCHLLEAYPDIELTANDIDEPRLRLIVENLERLNLQCELTHAELPDDEPREFESILLDVPCSASGIIRRHPDIKLLRREADIDKLSRVQAALLSAAWQWLTPGGKLVYSTCSIFPEENEQVIATFLDGAPDAHHAAFELPAGLQRTVGWQLLPTTDEHDGFYYCQLIKDQ